MALKHPSWTRDTTDKVGDGATYVLTGAAITIAGVTYRLPADVFEVGDQSDWVVSMAGEWERIRATVSNLDPFTLARDHVWESTNDDQAVNWQAGTKDSYVVFGADVALLGAENVFAANQFIRSTAGGAEEGPDLNLDRFNPSPTDGSFMGLVRWRGKNTADETITAIKLRAQWISAASGNERGALNIEGIDGGQFAQIMQIRGNVVRHLRPVALVGNFLHLDASLLASIRSTDGQSVFFRVNNTDRLQLTPSLLRLLGIGLEAGAITASGAVTATGEIVSDQGVRSNAGHLRSRANAANRHVWFEALNGAEHAVIWHDAASNALIIRTRNGPGGSITAQVQIGPAAGQLLLNGEQVAKSPVNQSQLKTSTVSQSGSISNGSSVLVSLGPYSFAPRIEGNIGLRVAPQQGESNADDAQFRIVNDTGPSQGYAVRWRRIDA